MKYRQNILRAILFISFCTVLYLTRSTKPTQIVVNEDASIGTPSVSSVDTAVTNTKLSAGVVNQPVVSTPKSDDRLTRFESLRKKVLLSNEERAEKDRVLSDLKTIHWIESYLSETPKGANELKGHLSAIDFLEEAIAWKENPSREEALESLENAIKVNQLGLAKKEVKRLVVGDKIELFTILSQEEPAKARALLESTQDHRLRDTLNYAVKRLSLGKKIGEGQ